MINPPNNKDLSNNIINFDKNRKFYGKKFLFTPSRNYVNNILNNNLNSNSDDFNMKIKSLLDNLQVKRDLLQNQYLLQLEDKKENTPNKETFDNYLSKINKKFDFIYNNETIFAKKNIVKPFLPSSIIQKPLQSLSPKFEKINIDVNIECIDDILKLIAEYPIKWNVQYNINMQSLHNIKKPLTNLNNMIGMKNLKSNIIDQILYFVQNLHKAGGQDNIDFMHTVIYGPPGTGKTEIANIMGQIFSNLGILKNKIFKKATRSDLIAGFLGQTAIKTKELVNSCLGGCLFIDEAYALGNIEKRDSFAKECIDTLCEALSFYKNDIMVIIAGYEKDLKDCFFAYNSGLESRFTWRFNTDNYNSKELNQIFHKKVSDISWSFSEEIPDNWFESKMDYFKYFGRDMETLLAKTKIAHSKRVFCKPEEEKRKITLDDINKGFEKFIDNDEVKKRKDEPISLSHMYI